MTFKINRRSLIAAFGSSALLGKAIPAWAQSQTHGISGAGEGIVAGEAVNLVVGHRPFSLGKRVGHAVTVNGLLPGPLIRLREGQNVRLSVTNTLAEDTSIHWHGILVPFQMDGVPGVSFPGIRPGQTFEYSFPIRQSGTYWYHSHSNMQDAMGMYGAIIIDPAGEDPIQYDREHVLILSDWSFEHPHKILKRLKQMGGYYNRHHQTLTGLAKGRDKSQNDRLMWGQMRMDPTDIADVSGATYTYLINGMATAQNWTGLFKPNERVRLRIINASAMTNFNVRIPGLAMTVVAADGQRVQPVETDEFQIAIAETYDIIVRPNAPQSYGVIAEAIDRSGLCRATLAPAIGMAAPVPPLRDRPLLSMADMGMDHGSEGMDHDMATMNHGPMKMDMRDASAAPQVRLGPGVATLSPNPVDRTGMRPTGLETEDHRVLTYRELKAVIPNSDRRSPEREIDVHLTANMERYMWSFDGVKFSDRAEPLAFRHNERVRVNLINHTMMPHPIHLHGHFFELVTGNHGHNPLKHTVNVLPGSKLSFDLTADALGDWAFHCHMLMHMHAGMFRVVTVREDA